MGTDYEAKLQAISRHCSHWRGKCHMCRRLLPKIPPRWAKNGQNRSESRTRKWWRVTQNDAVPKTHLLAFGFISPSSNKFLTVYHKGIHSL